MKTLTIFLMPLLALALLPACQSSVDKMGRNAAYSAYEFFGVEKRDLLRRHINSTREKQEETRETFKDALDKLRTIYGMQGGELEKQYKKFQSAYDESHEQADKLKAAREKMDTTANDLFEEWKKEIGEIQSADYKTRSHQKLKETMSRYAKLTGSVQRAEKKMDPVLAKLKDQMLFLKHNLNAESVASLKTEGVRIQNDMGKLVDDMNASIKEAETFTKTLD